MLNVSRGKQLVTNKSNKRKALFPASSLTFFMVKQRHREEAMKRSIKYRKEERNRLLFGVTQAEYSDLKVLKQLKKWV